MTALAALRSYWLTNEALYSRFADHVRRQVSIALHAVGVLHEASARAKSLDSLLTKAIRKRYSNPIEQTTDKAGVRVLLLYQDDISPAVAAIREQFDEVDFQDKRTSLPADVFTYQGVHCQIRLRPAPSSTPATEFNGLECEIQLHTRAQYAWSESTHDLVYKPVAQIPDSVKRRLHRLVALMELFDNEVSGARKDIMAIEGFRTAQILAHLEQCFYRMTDRAFDRVLSTATIEALLPLYGDRTAQQIDKTIDDFADAQAEKLIDVYRLYDQSEETDAVFLHQPERLLVFQQIETAPYRLMDLWNRHYPPELLDQLALAWGRPLG